MTAAAVRPFSINIYGHVCGDYSTPIMNRSRSEATASQRSVLGIQGLERGKLITSAQLRQNNGLTIAKVCEQNGWNTSELGFSKGGPAASAALAAVQLASNAGQVHYWGVVGKDSIGTRLAQYFTSYNMPTNTLIQAPGLHTSHTLVINEHVEGEKDGQRTFIHEPGANGEVTLETFPAAAFEVHEGARNIFMVGGSFLMPKFHPQGVLRIFQRAKEAAASKKETDAITILNTVHDPSGNWDLGENATALIDMLIMDFDEAKAIAGMDVSENNMPTLLDWFKQQGFRNAAITNGTKGAYVYSTDDNVLLPVPQHLAMHFPASSYVMKLDRPKYGLGCGDVTAGALAVAIAEHMNLETAMLFAMSAGGTCALNEPGEIGGPCKQGGQRARANETEPQTVFEQVFERMQNQFDPGPSIMALPGMDYDAIAARALEAQEEPQQETPATPA